MNVAVDCRWKCCAVISSSFLHILHLDNNSRALCSNVKSHLVNGEKLSSVRVSGPGRCRWWWCYCQLFWPCHLFVIQLLSVPHFRLYHRHPAKNGSCIKIWSPPFHKLNLIKQKLDGYWTKVQWNRGTFHGVRNSTLGKVPRRICGSCSWFNWLINHSPIVWRLVVRGSEVSCWWHLYFSAHLFTSRPLSLHASHILTLFPSSAQSSVFVSEIFKIHSENIFTLENTFLKSVFEHKDKRQN